MPALVHAAIEGPTAAPALRRSVQRALAHAGKSLKRRGSDALRSKLGKLRRRKEQRGESLEPDAPLFVSQRGTRLSTRQLRHAFTVWQERAGFERHVSLHALRHSSCSAMYARTKDLRLTQRFARHRSVVTTMIYTHPSDEDLARAVELLRC